MQRSTYNITNADSDFNGGATNKVPTASLVYCKVPIKAADLDYESARPGDRGELVVEIQDCLIQEGYLESITGVYDEATEEAVRAFQKKNGLTADGVAGEKTLAVLFGY